MARENTKYTFLWLIENYSYCCYNKREKLESPHFTPDGTESISWYLRLYPRGTTLARNSRISLFLVRSEHDTAPKKFHVRYELAVTAEDGSPIKSKGKENTFCKGHTSGYQDFLCADEVLSLRKTEYLAQDTLRVRCTMWYNASDTRKIENVSARTRIGIEKISFLRKVENFSALKPNEIKYIQIQSQSQTKCVISSDLYITESSCGEDEVIVEIACSERKYNLCKQKLSLLTGSENVVECGKADIRFDPLETKIHLLPLSLTRQAILDRKTEYLPNDELSLICECSFSTGIDFEKIEETQHELPVAALKKSGKHERKVEKLSACTSVSEDMTSVYIDQCLTDVVLKTKTKTFPAHKIVLCARSSVFKAMLTNDMKEKNSDCIQVDDLEDDTLQRLLLFLYSDNLENIQWESAIKLYYAGDKYAIDKLKVLCSSFLVDNVSTSTASELLLLADTHNDSELRNSVEDFILTHDERIFDAEDWKNLEVTNPQLVIKTMYLMLKSKKRGK